MNKMSPHDARINIAVAMHRRQDLVEIEAETIPYGKDRRETIRSTIRVWPMPKEGTLSDKPIDVINYKANRRPSVLAYGFATLVEGDDVAHFRAVEQMRKLCQQGLFTRFDFVTPIMPCGTCGNPTEMLGTKRCDRCWETESRLPDYLKLGSKAVAFVAGALSDRLSEESI